MKKIIFLDVDGVLNNETFKSNWMREHEGLDRNYLEIRFDHLFEHPTGMPFFDGRIYPDNLANWNKLIETLGDAQVVFSSDWRFICDGTYSNVTSVEVIQSLFTYRNIKGNVIGATPYVHDHDRATEILRYIRENPDIVKDAKILILDDLQEPQDVPRIVKDIYGIKDCKAIWTYYKEGLTKKDVKEAIEFFKEDENE